MIALPADTLYEILSPLSPLLASSPPLNSMRGVSIDTRTLEVGNLYVAVQGEKTHGHLYVEEAFKKGASMALVEDPSLLSHNNLYASVLIAVTDTVQALQLLSSWWRDHIECRRLGVVGSIGKTSAKELLRHFLSKIYPGTASEKSFNNHLGVPLTLCSMKKQDKWAVLELGMNHPGELSLLSKLARPVGVLVTCIAPEHMEFFTSLDEVADAECEVLDGLSLPLEEKFLVIPDDDDVLVKALDRHARGSQIPRFLFGSSPLAHMRISEVFDLKEKGSEFTLTYNKNESIHLTSPLLGLHNVKLVAASILLIKLSFPEIALDKLGSSLKTFSPPSHRLTLKAIQGKKIIDDSYNSSPEAVKAALHITHSLCGTEEKWGVILGDMLELGESSDFYHQIAGKEVVGVKPHFVITVGNASKQISDMSGDVGIPSAHFNNALDVVEYLNTLEYDILLIKGSRGIHLDRIITALESEKGNE